VTAPQAAAVSHQIANEDAAQRRAAQLRQIIRYGAIRIEPPGSGQTRNSHRRERLADGGELDGCVHPHRLAACQVLDAVSAQLGVVSGNDGQRQTRDFIQRHLGANVALDHGERPRRDFSRLG
jgi:hypothetical protein